MQIGRQKRKRRRTIKRESKRKIDALSVTGGKVFAPISQLPKPIDVQQMLGNAKDFLTTVHAHKTGKRAHQK